MGADRRQGLDMHGLANVGTVHWNLAVPALYEQSMLRHEAKLADRGALAVFTGQHTGRSPQDRFIVREPSTESDIWWGNVNRPISVEHFDRVFAKVQAYLQGRDAFVQDCYAGADPEYRLKVRVVTEFAWHSLFARNMFIPLPEEARPGFEPDFTVIDTPVATHVEQNALDNGQSLETRVTLVNFNVPCVGSPVPDPDEPDPDPDEPEPDPDPDPDEPEPDDRPERPDRPKRPPRGPRWISGTP